MAALLSLVVLLGASCLAQRQGLRVARPKQAAHCPLAFESSGEQPFSDAEHEKIRSYFLRNVDLNGSGAVVAAPDHDTGEGGSYYYDWERDGALSMRTLLLTAPSWEAADAHLQHYTHWVLQVQGREDHHGIDVRTEPKYEIPSGEPFAGDWCRPQTDGPGLRGRTLAEYALALLRRSDTASYAFVRDFLWTGDEAVHRGGAVKCDLDWVVANWRSGGCDLWEEFRSDDFFWGRYAAFRAGLHVGAQLAHALGDAASEQRYLGAKAEIEGTLAAHYEKGFVFEARGREKDSAVIEAFLVGDLQDGIFAPLSREVLGTVAALNELFCGAYKINQADTEAGVPGILYGRYEGDHYAGGNPWVLLTASLASLLFRQAAAALESGPLEPEVQALLAQAYSIPSGLAGRALGDALAGAGDGVLLRIKYHTAAYDLHMAEQIGRDDGLPKSAKDLTWNYANVLLALHARSDYKTKAAASP